MCSIVPSRVRPFNNPPCITSHPISPPYTGPPNSKKNSAPLYIYTHNMSRCLVDDVGVPVGEPVGLDSERRGIGNIGGFVPSSPVGKHATDTATNVGDY